VEVQIACLELELRLASRNAGAFQVSGKKAEVGAPI
jgi:hypothetical protein